MTPRLKHLISAACLLLPLGVQAMRVDNLKCEYRKDPTGVDVERPRLSWQLQSDTRGDRQTAYQVLVARTPEALAQGKGDAWDSGRVESDQSFQVEYAGAALPSNGAAYWKVRAWDAKGQPGEWSKPAQWSVGLLQPADWTGKWIGKDETTTAAEQLLPGASWIWVAGEAKPDAPAGKAYFRATLDVPAGEDVQSAVLQASADNAFTLYLNGAEVGKGSNFNSAQHFDLSRSLAPGKNTIAVVVENHGGAPNPAGLIASARVKFASGKELKLATGDNWRGTREETKGWSDPEFDDSAWQAAGVVAAYGDKPWGKPEARDDNRRLPARMLRREFATEKPIKRATAHVSGMGLFELYLNGERISDNVLQPALTDYDKQVPSVSFDVTKNVKSGQNALGVWLGNGRFFAPRLSSPVPTLTYGYPKLRLQLEIEYDDGSTGRVVSDDQWKLTTNGPINANNEYDGEEYDARKEVNGWSNPGFDAGTWEAVQLVEAPKGVLTAQTIEPIRVVETLKAKKVTEPKPGMFIVDMGQNMVGWCRIRVNGPAGTEVKLRHAETLTTDGLLYMANIRDAKVTDLYTLKGGGEETWEPRFTYHGFRYVEVTGWPGKLSPDAIEGRVVHDDMPRAGEFACSNELLNRIYGNIIWGTRGNYRSIPTDCPQRDERQGWLGDRSEESRGESYLYDVAAFYAKWVRDMKESQKETGSIPDVAPNYWPFYSDGIVWPSSFVIIPHTMYGQYGDTRIISDNYDKMKLWVNYMKGFMKDGTMPKNQYGDWCVPPEDPTLIHSKDPARQTNPELVSTTYYYHDARLMAKMARLIGKEADAAEFEKLAEGMKEAFNRKFLKAEGLYDNGSQTAQVLPLAFGLVPDDKKAAVFAHLVKKIEGETNYHIGTGLVGGQWLMRVLSDNGRADLALRIATNKTYPSWGYMLENGATTIWELWNGNTADPAMNSHNHVMLIGDLNIWFHEYLGGIRPASPGFKSIVIKPYVIDGLDHASAKIQAPAGEIRSAWKRGSGGKGLTLDVSIPVNTTATVHLPASAAANITEGGKALDAAGLKVASAANGKVAVEVGSGKYSFAINE